MIRLVHATKHYGPATTGACALRDVSLTVPAGQFLALMGPSGCGKSTLLHILGGLDRVTSGEVYLDGQAIHQLDDNGLTRLRRTHLGIIFQFFNLLPTLTVLENVELPGLLQGLPAASTAARARHLIEEVGLSQRTHHQLHQLSGGEMQRAALARSLLMEPKVLLADEPTGNLDSETSRTVMRLFREIGERHGTTIVMVTHSREIAACTQRIVEMKDGRITHHRE